MPKNLSCSWNSVHPARRYPVAGLADMWNPASAPPGSLPDAVPAVRADSGGVLPMMKSNALLFFFFFFWCALKYQS